MADTQEKQPSLLDELTPDLHADLEVPFNVQISPSGDQVVYEVTNPSRKEKRVRSSIWVAVTDAFFSARQFTSGKYRDTQPVWHPNGNPDIIFLSDRAGHEAESCIYSQHFPNGEAKPLTPVENKKQIAMFRIRPDGKQIAFLSPDEDSAEMKRRKDEKDDAKVYGEHWEFNRVRLLDVESGEVETLDALFEPGPDRHVIEIAWSEDGHSLAIISEPIPEIDSGLVGGCQIHAWSTDSGYKKWADFPGMITSMAWSKSTLFFQSGYTPDSAATAWMIYKVSVEDVSKGQSPSRYAFGESNSTEGLRSSIGGASVRVQEGLRDQIHLLDSGEKIYDYVGDIGSWDVHNTHETMVVVIRSSVCKPAEVYSHMHGKSCCLSTHGEAIANLPIASAEPFYCTADDGTKLDAILALPAVPATKKPYPTAVFIHGGPYGRTTMQYYLPLSGAATYVLANGYAVLCPNYRGGSGRGETFAANARGGVGKDDYSDVITIVKAAIDRGIVDPDKVIVGGWSQGGFLSYYSTTRPEFDFKGAICGAGVTDWDTMTMTSDATAFEAELAGGAPWEVDPARTHPRNASAIWRTDRVKRPVLILHGEDDIRVPVSQAKAFHKACLRRGVPCQMVLYPREGHMGDPPAERAHCLDIIRRIVGFCNEHLV